MLTGNGNIMKVRTDDKKNTTNMWTFGTITGGVMQ